MSYKLVDPALRKAQAAEQDGWPGMTRRVGSGRLPGTSEVAALPRAAPAGRAPAQRAAVPGHSIATVLMGQASPTQMAGTGGKALPEAVRAKMEGSLRMDFSAVRVHEGPRAMAMGALAFTQGTDIHFAPGQYRPYSERGQEILGHELAHVVQQAQGRVRASRQMKGVGLNDDPALEREADELGQKAARGVAAPYQALARRGDVGSESPGGDSRIEWSADATAPTVMLYPQIPSSSQNSSQPAQPIVQRKEVRTWAGVFKTPKFQRWENDGRGRQGIDIRIEFEPDRNMVDAKKIGIAQVVCSKAKSEYTNRENQVEPFYIQDSEVMRSRTLTDSAGGGAGTRIDQNPRIANPLYAVIRSPKENLEAGKTNLVPWIPWHSKGEHGYCYRGLGGITKKKSAWIVDTPRMRRDKKETSQTFETTALAVDGRQKGTYYGSVTWGWSKNADEQMTYQDIEATETSLPTPTFEKARAKWGTSTIEGGGNPIELPPIPMERIITLQTDVPVTDRAKQRILPAGTVVQEMESEEESESTLVRVVKISDAQVEGESLLGNIVSIDNNALAAAKQD